MVPVIPKPRITAKQKRAALMVAGAVDLLQVVLLPALLPGVVADDVLDVVAAVVLVAVCGFKWQFAVAFGVELVPFLGGIFPTWTAMVLTLRSGPAGETGEVQVRGAEAAGGKEVVDVEGVLVPPVRARGLSEGQGSTRPDEQAG